MFSISPRGARRAGALGLALVALALGGCRQDMHDQPRFEPLEASTFYADGRASRAPVADTVARGQLRENESFYTGLDEAGNAVTELPVALDAALLERGRVRYDIFCSPCHSRVGDGAGMIVRRGYKQPESFHTDRLRAVPVGYVVDVITRGFGQMPKYAAQIPAKDRWAIAAYVKALQYSQHAPAGELPAEVISAVENAPAAPADDSAHSEGS